MRAWRRDPHVAQRIMRPDQRTPPRALVIQLARLGDLVQTLPLLDALGARHSGMTVDVLCAAPLAALVHQCFPVGRALPWDGSRCRRWADDWGHAPLETTRQLHAYIESLCAERYDVAYNLNQHERAVLAAHLLADQVTGAGAAGPASTGSAAWAAYLRRIAHDRGRNRIHLADAFCGLCGRKPTGRALLLPRGCADLPTDLQGMAAGDADCAALIVGAGDAERCVAPSVWTAWIDCFLRAHSRGRVILLGSSGEREAAQAVQSALPSMLLGRVWDATGRTDLLQLVTILSRSTWVVGADTGPLHLGTAVGAQAIGWYFARARVHETGPYGTGHWVFQHRGPAAPVDWPIEATVDVMLTGRFASSPQWEVWGSRLDEWGAYFVNPSDPDPFWSTREAVWKDLSPALTEVETA